MAKIYGEGIEHLTEVVLSLKMKGMAFKATLHADEGWVIIVEGF